MYTLSSLLLLLSLLCIAPSLASKTTKLPTPPNSSAKADKWEKYVDAVLVSGKPVPDQISAVGLAQGKLDSIDAIVDGLKAVDEWNKLLKPQLFYESRVISDLLATLHSLKYRIQNSTKVAEFNDATAKALSGYIDIVKKAQKKLREKADDRREELRRKADSPRSPRGRSLLTM